MSGDHRPPFDARGFLIVFLGRGGLGLGLALAAGVVLIGLGRVDGGTPLLLGGTAVLAATVLVLLVTRRRLRQAAENLAEAAIDERN